MGSPSASPSSLFLTCRANILPSATPATPYCPAPAPHPIPLPQSYITDLQRFTKNHAKLQCFDLGFALDTFRMVALTSNFRKLQSDAVVKACQRCE